MPPPPPPGPPLEGRADGAFDLWLQRGLHQLFDGIAREPIPDDLLRLIEEDRREHPRKDQPIPQRQDLEKDGGR